MNKKNTIIIIVVVIFIFVLFLFYMLFGRQKSFTITFNTDGGTKIQSIKVKNGETLKLPENPTKENYTFAGWLDEDKEIIIDGSKITKDIKLTSKWINDKVSSIKITFDTPTGTANMIFEKDESLSLPLIQDTDGYSFIGWLDEENHLITNEFIASKDMKLKAYVIKSDAETKNVKFMLDDDTLFANIKLINNDNIIFPVNPIKDGYVFAGWYDKEGNKISNLRVDKNIILIAKWKTKYTYPSDCTVIGDGSTCTKQITTKITITNVCPNGYSLINNKCVDIANKYHATNENDGWHCNSSSEYMYTEEDGFGGAFMWCAKTTSGTTKESCPNEYIKDGNFCKKDETITCKEN